MTRASMGCRSTGCVPAASDGGWAKDNAKPVPSATMLPNMLVESPGCQRVGIDVPGRHRGALPAKVGPTWPNAGRLDREEWLLRFCPAWCSVRPGASPQVRTASIAEADRFARLRNRQTRRIPPPSTCGCLQTRPGLLWSGVSA